MKVKNTRQIKIEEEDRGIGAPQQDLWAKGKELIDISFLSIEMKGKYHDLLGTRLNVLKIK